MNIASRIQTVAGAGGICVSMDVERQIRSALEARLKKLAPTELKNIHVAMELYRIVLPWEKNVESEQDARAVVIRARRKSSFAWAAAALLGLAVIGGGFVWWRELKPAAQTPSIKAAPTAKSVAVLPFVNLSPDKENEYLSDGVTEDLCTALTQVKGLRVPARTSSFAFKGKTEDIRKIGEQLNVGTVLEGSVSKAGNKLRISAQLVNVADGFHLWAANYDREMTDILDIRSDISRRVVEALKVQLGVEETQRLTKKPTEATEAYDSYLLGRYELNKFTEAGFTNSVNHFKQAIAIDPTFALAHAGLAEAYTLLGFWNYFPPKEQFPEAKKEAQRALDLDPDLSEAHTVLAYIRFQYEWKFNEAEIEFKEAIRLNPGSVDARLWFWEYLLDLGRSQEAHKELERAKELDPLSVRVSFNFAVESFFERDFNQALERTQKIVSLDPNNAIACGLIEAILWLQNKPVEAFDAAEKANALEGIFSQQEIAEMRKAYDVGGYSGYLRKENELRQQHLARGKYQSPLIIALVYARAGANSEALDWLEKAVEERAPWLPEINNEPTWDGIRSQPRFVALLKKIGLEK